MLKVEDRFMIKDLHRRGITISDIARISGHDRKTIRAVLNGPVNPPPQRRKTRAGKLDSSVPYLERRIEEGVLNCNKLLDEIRNQGYQGGKSTLKYFVQPCREARRQEATVRFETLPGEQAQVDWGHFGFIEHHGRRRKLYGFVMTLGWSRASYLEFTISADAAWWLRCHAHAFHYFRCYMRNWPGLLAHHHLCARRARAEIRAALYLVLHNLLFILPLVVVFVLAYLGTTSQQLAQFINRRAATVKLLTASLFLLLAGWLVVTPV